MPPKIPPSGISDPEAQDDPTALAGLGYVPTISAIQMAYGGSPFPANGTDSRLYRLERGYPFKRAGHAVPVMPQFKAQNLTIQNIASQPQANRSATEITRPSIDPATTNNVTGTPFIGYPGFNKTNLT